MKGKLSNSEIELIKAASREAAFELLKSMGIIGNASDMGHIVVQSNGKRWLIKPLSIEDSHIKKLHYKKIIQGKFGRLVTQNDIDHWNSIVSITNHSELSLNDGTNPHGTTKSDLNLENVDNTSDLNKPISNATQTALNTKLSSVPQATESILGGGEIATGSDAANELSTNDTDIVTPKKLWTNFVPRILNLAWTWLQKQTHNVAPRFNTVSANQILEVDSNKDLIGATKGTAHNKNFGSSASTVAEGNDFRFGQSEQARTYSSVSLANNTIRTPSSVNDVLVIITPSLQAGIGQTASISVQVDNSGGGTFQTIATSTNTNALTITLGLLGGSSTQAQPITFKVAKSSRYRYVTSGSGSVTILQHFELQE